MLNTRIIRFTALSTLFLFANCANSDLDPMGIDGGEVGNNGTENNGNPNNGNPNNGNPNNGAVNNGADTGDALSQDTGPDIAPVVCESGAAGWSVLGRPLSIYPGETNGTQPAIAIDSLCRPVIAFHEGVEGESPNIHVMRWENGAWNDLGGPLDATGQTDKFTTAVSIRTFGTDVVAGWSELTDDGTRVFIGRWNGTDWQISAPAPNGGPLFSFTIGLVLDANGNPTVAWNERPPDLNHNIVRVAKLENDIWTDLGGNVFAGTNSGALAPSLVADAQGRPVVAWQEMNDIRVRTWDGATWATIPPDPGKETDAFSAFDANIASNGSHLILGWRESAESTDVFVSKLDGLAWTPVTQGLSVEPETNGRTNTNNLALAVSPTGETFFAFDELRESTTYVHVYKNGTAIGELSEVPGETSAYWAAIALDIDDRPVVAWSEDDGTSIRVHVSRFIE